MQSKCQRLRIALGKIKVQKNLDKQKRSAEGLEVNLEETNFDLDTELSEAEEMEIDHEILEPETVIAKPSTCFNF
jgi:hypothetical protein